jgi:hypothetical protein
MGPVPPTPNILTSGCYAKGKDPGAEMAYGDDVHSTALLMKFHAEMGASVRLGFP